MNQEINDVFAEIAAGSVPALEFKKFEHANFLAEYAVDGNDLVFHFFRTAARRERNYWNETFPNALSTVAEDVFKATYPRLKAAHTYDLGIDSWWLRANGFVGLDPDTLVTKFFSALDSSLSAT